MKIVIVLSFVALSISTASIIDNNELIEIEWSRYKSNYGKTYHDPKEENKRRQIYKSNKMIINTHNEKYDKGQVTYSLGINQFADMTLHEFSTKMNGLKRNLNGKEKNYIKNEAKDILNCKKHKIPKAKDWRKKGYVTPVKNQEACGSCWAFSATGSLEGQHFRNSNVLVSLSEQNLIDCSRDYNNQGCDGGLMVYAFEYINDNKGIDTEESYPYEAKNDVCRYISCNSGATDIGYVNIPEGDEDALLCAVATVGPVSVAIDSASHEFQLYKKGVFYNPRCSSTELNHGVLAVGFGTDKRGGDYWIVKNSWGNKWGDEGYILMARNKDNNCGIATMASYPLV